ncbi:hypothetical protein N0V91_011342, partial [Didymella pomorum]
SGIGLATTRILLDRGARVFGIDISPFSQGAGGKEAFTFHQVDLTKSDAANEAVAVCLREYGPKIDVLANVAGIMDAFGSVDTVKESEWERVLSINLTVPVRLMAAVLPSMQEHKGGAIVNVASRAALSGAVAGVAYTASKHGLVGATKNVAWRFHNDGIRCNAVLPGGGDAQGVPQVDITAEDVAHAIVFLASDEAKKINGVLMPVDNAWSTI